MCSSIARATTAYAGGSRRSHRGEKGAKQIGVGSIGDKALALARHPDVLAVCGAKKVATDDLVDAFTVLARPGQDDEEELRRRTARWNADIADAGRSTGDSQKVRARVVFKLDQISTTRSEH